MARITEECVARIKDAADIVSVVNHYVTLRRAGTAWKACCPFHSEKTPSFHVNPARQSYRCFGCGEGGDAVKFIMRFENVDYPTALRRLADMSGVPVVEEEENPEIARQRRLRARVVELNELAAGYYHRLLCRSKQAAHVRAYLKERGLTLAIAKEWELGWAPPDFHELRTLAESRGMDTRLLTEAYLLGKGVKGLYPVFTDRLMFPIRNNLRKEVVGFSGRVMQADKDPRKYVNTAETVAFRKGELLFGLYKATRAISQQGMCVVICEGQLDVIACHELADIRNAVAGLGTAFTDEHARHIAKFAKKAILCYDGDQAGIKASEKTFRKLAQVGIEVYQAALPPGEDPDSLIRNHGAEALRRAIEQAQPYIVQRTMMELERSRGDVNAKAGIVPLLVDLTAEIKDSMAREAAALQVCTRMHIGIDTIRLMLENNMQERQKRDATKRPAPAASYDESADDEITAAPPRLVVPIVLHSAIRDLINLIYSSIEAQTALLERVEELQEAIRSLSGGVILQRLLEELPPPKDAAAWEAFVQGLPPEQALALKDVQELKAPAELLEQHVQDTCAAAAHAALSSQRDLLRTEAYTQTSIQENYIRMIDEAVRLNKIVSVAPTQD